MGVFGKLFLTAGVVALGFVAWGMFRSGGSGQRRIAEGRAGGGGRLPATPAAPENDGGAAANAKKKEQALQADIAALAGEYRAAYLRYALHDEAYGMNVDLAGREAVRAARDTTDVMPPFDLVEKLREKGYSATQVAAGLNAYLADVLHIPAQDARIPEATLEKALQKEAGEAARKDIAAILAAVKEEAGAAGE